MITFDETKSLNTMLMKVKAAETERLLAHKELLAARTLCDEKKNNADILLKQSEQYARYVWNLWNFHKNIESEFEQTMCQTGLLQMMWQTGFEADEAKCLLDDAEKKVMIAEERVKITEAKKTKALEPLKAACNSSADLLFNENEQHLRECYPEVDLDEIKTLLSKVLFRRIEYPEDSRCNVIGCLCDKKLMKPRHSHSIIDSMEVCKPCKDDCTICLEPLILKQCVITSCKHIFHRSCIYQLEKTDEFSLCPLCRNPMCILSQEEDKYHFLQFQKCECCERHKRNRPMKLSSKAVVICQCSNPRADVLMELLRKYDNSIRITKCNCNCRKQMRMYCKIYSNTFGQSDDSDMQSDDWDSGASSDSSESDTASDFSEFNESDILLMIEQLEESNNDF